MTPEEWPIAAPDGQAVTPACAAGRGRLRTVRIDFFLRPEERLSEQERALMTAMLHCLVGDIAVQLRAALPPGLAGANDDEAALVDALTRAGLLDRPALIALLLQRADEERIGLAARARSGRREARALQALVSNQHAEVSAAAMGLILGRGRRRNPFGQCILTFDDLPADTAAQLGNAVAAALGIRAGGVRGSANIDEALSAAAAELAGRHDPRKSAEALMEALVRSLAGAGAMSDDLILAAAQEGEVAFLAQAAAVRANLSGAVGIEEFLSAETNRLIRLLRLAGFSRDLCAGILASIGDLLGIEDPGAAISAFDAIDDDQLALARDRLAASAAYRDALDALGAARG